MSKTMLWVFMLFSSGLAVAFLGLHFNVKLNYFISGARLGAEQRASVTVAQSARLSLTTPQVEHRLRVAAAAQPARPSITAASQASKLTGGNDAAASSLLSDVGEADAGAGGGPRGSFARGVERLA